MPLNPVTLSVSEVIRFTISLQHIIEYLDAQGEFALEFSAHEMQVLLTDRMYGVEGGQ